ncbi:hypothetical protein B0H17DRAFT_954317 [Mycena rosella]|uniref:Required for respiratory growth protein 7, mitochondrial n=1 Tax=Mycena rosella TaxID=1033263 RepID=A0AAD7CS23_MYCRO|nr:hypothetical protein B0H17DRAFT_954317 [Mycena rosella]
MQAAQRTCLHFRRSLSTASPILTTVQRGNVFEERSKKILQDHLSMSLRRVGGKSDGGIDLMGWWWLPPADSDPQGPAPGAPPTRRRLRVLAQCKAEKKKMGPNYVREMEGVLHRYMSLVRPSASPGLSLSSSSQEPLVALLVSESPFTKSTILRAQSSPVPFFLLHIPPIPETDADEDPPEDEAPPEDATRIGTAVWNPALAGVRGLLEGKMEARWERSLTGAGRPGLWWGGKRLSSWTPDGGFEQLTMENEDRFFAEEQPANV